jgi:hypothetical protein
MYKVGAKLNYNEIPLIYAENTAVWIRHADHLAPSISKKLTLTSLTSGGRLVGIVRLRT